MDFQENTPSLEDIKDDSGYDTNTPLSCEVDRQLMECVPEENNVIDISSCLYTDFQSTPLVTNTKLKQKNLNSNKLFEGIFIHSKTPLNICPKQNDFSRSQSDDQSHTINDYRKRLHSMPNLSSYEPIKNDSCREIPSKRVFKRLVSIDLTANSIYQGWFKFNAGESDVHVDEKVDFIAKLCKERLLLNIAIQIFGNLEPQDLVSASQVTTLWQTVIKQDKALALKLKRFNASNKTDLHSNKENTEPGDFKGKIGRRSSCVDITNVLMSKRGSGGPVTLPAPAQSMPSSINDTARKNGRWLRMCPKCTHPAQVEMCGKLARCLRVKCALLFCVKCRFRAHGEKECKVEDYESPKRIIIGSKISKRNIRRL